MGDATEDKTAARAVSTLPVGRHRRNVETALAAVFPLPVPRLAGSLALPVPRLAGSLALPVPHCQHGPVRQ